MTALKIRNCSWATSALLAIGITITMLRAAVAEVAAVEAPVGNWAQRAALPISSMTHGSDDTDLEPLAKIIGNARIVSFGEGLHGGAEALEFRNRLFRFLVRRLGFTAIALESGAFEGFQADDYVQGGSTGLDEALKKGLTFGFDQLPQERALLQWMHDYNQDPRHGTRIAFFGMDVSGNDKDMQRPLWAALDYLAERDPAAASTLRQRIADLKPRLVLDRMSTAPHQYTELTQAERDRVSGVISDLIALLAMRETEYAKGPSVRGYVRAMRAAVSARQVDDYLRRLPIGWSIKSGYAGLESTVASADATKAENIAWILQQTGPHGRLLLFAHRDHLVPAPSVIKLTPDAAPWALPPMVGLYLKPRYGHDLVTIGQFFARYSVDCGKPAVEAPAGSFERQLESVPYPFFLLDLRHAPTEVEAWLAERRPLFGVPPINTAAIRPGYDAILFTQSVTPAVACR